MLDEHIVFSGTYELTTTIPTIGPFERTVRPGEMQTESLLPEENRRSYLFVTADRVNLPSHDVFDFRAVPSSGVYPSAAIPMQETSGNRVGLPVMFFDAMEGPVELRVGGYIHPQAISLVPGEATRIHVRRLEVEHPHNIDGTEAPRTYALQRVGDPDPISRAIPTRTGIDLVTGDYEIIVSSSTAGTETFTLSL